MPFYNNPGVLEDYVYRSVHLEAELGKQIVEEFYGRKHSKSYYLGCSTGGRQGFKEAKDFPNDFDGIVAGAPAFDLIVLMYWTGHFFVKTGDSSAPQFPFAAQWDKVYADENPNLCQYPPKALICAPEQSPSDGCLTGEQATTVRKVLSPVYGSDGQLVYPRLQPGFLNATGHVFNWEPHQYPTDWFRYVVYNYTARVPATLGPQDYEVASMQNPLNARTWKGDLSAARERGTKILHYHGLQDELISSDNLKRYYDHVSTTMNLPSDNLDDFYRYFRISGLGHCSDGSGPNMIGGNLDTFAEYDPESNVLAAIVDWIENGVAPDYILGKRLAENGEVDLARRHCKYPKQNVYVGEGDPAAFGGWKCV